MTVRVICDSSQNVPEDFLSRLGILECPASVVFGDEVYLNKQELTHAQFYQRLAALPSQAPLPTTTQPSPGQYLRAIRQAKAEGAQEILLTAVSAKLSGTYNSAVQAAAEEHDLPIAVWDTESVSLGGGWQTIVAAELAEAGASLGDIVSALADVRRCVHATFTVDTLRYLVASGRLTSFQGLIGSLLNVKPMLIVEDGILKPVGRERGRKAAKRTLIEMIQARVGQRPVRLAIVNSNVPDEAEAFREDVSKALNVRELLVAELGPALAALAGPGVIALGALQVES